MGSFKGSSSKLGPNVIIGGELTIKEQANAEADVTGQGQIWIKASDNNLYFTNEGGDDVQITDGSSVNGGGGGGSLSGLGSTDNAILRANGTGGETAQGSSATISDAGVVSGSRYTGFSIATPQGEFTTSVSSSNFIGSQISASLLVSGGLHQGHRFSGVTGDFVTLSGSTATLDNITLGNTAISSTAAEINLLDGCSAETIVNSKAVIYGNVGEVTGSRLLGFDLGVTEGEFTSAVTSRAVVNIVNSAATSEPHLLLSNTSTAVDKPSTLRFFRNQNGAQQDSMGLGELQFRGHDGAGNALDYAVIRARASDITNDDEGGEIKFFAMAGGASGSTAAGLQEFLHIGGARAASSSVGGPATSATVQVNQENKDIDFMVRGVYVNSLLRTDAANDRVGIGLPDPGALAHVFQGETGNDTAFRVENLCTDQVLMHLTASNVDATVLDIAAGAVTSADVLKISANKVTTGKAINISVKGLTSGKAFAIDADSDSLNGGRVVDIFTDSTSTNAYTLMKLTKNSANAHNSNAIVGLDIDFNATNGEAARAFRIDSEQTDGIVAEINGDGITTGTVLDISADGLSSGDAVRFSSNSNSTNNRSVLKLSNTHISSEGTACLEIDQQSSGSIISAAYGANGAGYALKMKDSGATPVNTSGDTTTLTDFIPANAIPFALSVRVVSAIGNNAFIKAVGAEDGGSGELSRFFMGGPETNGSTDLGDGVLEELNDIVTSAVNGLDGLFGTDLTERDLEILHNATPDAGQVRVIMWYWLLTPPTQ